jgi:hypothetical protein
MTWIFWAILGASLLHVVEEYSTDWVDSVRDFIPRVTVRRFWIVNLVFISTCLVGAIVNEIHIIFSLSMAGLILVNAFTHIVVSYLKRSYTPGLFSSIFIYIPVSTYAFYNSLISGISTINEAAFAVMLGVIWMSLPIAYLLLENRIDLQGSS